MNQRQLYRPILCPTSSCLPASSIDWWAWKLHMLLHKLHVHLLDC